MINNEPSAPSTLSGRKTALFACASALALLACGGAQAQTAASAAPTAQAGGAGTVEEVIVTAQKRRENIQDVPVAVTAITARDATSQGLTSTLSLSAAVPGLVIVNPANVGNPYLRGVGSNLFDPSSEQSVATYVDGVYIAAPQSNLFSFNNISDIEVLKGPQGTLFGRNATGGVIQITTQDPSFTPKGDVSVGYGNYNDVTSSLYLTGGLGDKIAIDGAALYEDQGRGYGRNLTTHTDTFREAIGNFSLRSKVLMRPTTTTKIVLSVDYSHAVSTNAYQKPEGVVSPLDGSTYSGPYNALSDLNDRNTVNTGGASLRLDQDLGAFHLTDIVAYRATKVTYDLDDDVSTLPVADIVLNPRAHNYSEEFQFSNNNKGWFHWIVGAFVYKAQAGYDPVTIDGFEQIADTQSTTSYAGFGQVTATVLPRTEITLGARYTDETQTYNLTFPFALTDSQHFGRGTYRAAIDYHVTHDIMAYASYNTGFKSGGFNLLGPGNSFAPEFLTAYEGGLKTELFDHRLRLNVDGFYYNDRNVQVLSAFNGGTITSNAAGAHIHGFEADFKAAIIGNLRVSGGVSLQRGHYTSYPDAVKIDQNGVSSAPTSEAGDQTLITPHFTGSVTVENTWQTHHGDLVGSVTLIHNDGYYWQSDNRLQQPAYTLVNTSLLWTLPGDRYDVRLWARNLSDATYYIARLSVAGIGDVQEQAAPRTYGVTVSAHF